LKPHTFNFINAIALIVMPFGGYVLKENPSITSLIPAVFGVFLLFCHKGIKNQNKPAARVAVVLTVLIILLLIMPLRFVFRKEDTIGIIQVGVMMITSLFSFISFTMNSINARKTNKNI